MIAGRFAFQGLSEYLTWQKIKQLDYTFPEGFDPDAADLVRRLLVRTCLDEYSTLFDLIYVLWCRCGIRSND